MTTIGERIAKTRERIGMSQEELAKRAGYKSRSSINKIENGRECSSKIVEKIAVALGVSPAYLMGWEERSDEQNRQIGIKMKELRTSKNLALYEMANELHIEPELLAQYEEGKRQIPEHVIEMYSNYFGVDVLMVSNNQTAFLTQNEKLKERYERWNKEFAYKDNFTDSQIEYIIRFAKLVSVLADDEVEDLFKYADFIQLKKG